jgi:hypothetical protein
MQPKSQKLPWRFQATSVQSSAATRVRTCTSATMAKRGAHETPRCESAHEEAAIATTPQSAIRRAASLTCRYMPFSSQGEAYRWK